MHAERIPQTGPKVHILTFDFFGWISSIEAAFHQESSLGVTGFISYISWCDRIHLITEWKPKGKNTVSINRVELQFLEHLHRELANIYCSQQSEAALKNTKTLLLLEIDC